MEFLRRPTFYFDGERSAYCDDALKMQHLAQAKGKQFRTFIIPGADHFNILQPLTRLIAKKVRQDTGSECNVAFDATELRRAVDQNRK